MVETAKSAPAFSILIDLTVVDNPGKAEGMIGKTPIRELQMINGYALESIVGLDPPHEQLHRAPSLTNLGLQILQQMPGAGPRTRITRDSFFFNLSGSGEVVYHFDHLLWAIRHYGSDFRRVS